MKKFPFIVVTVVALLVCTLSASAVQYNITGDWEGWTGAGPLMNETSPGSGSFQVTVPLTNAFERHEFKVTTGSWATNWPSSGNSWFITDGSGNITITWDTNVYSDAYIPVTNRIGASYDPGTWTAVGDWQNQVGGAIWDNANTNTAMASLGGGIYKFTTTLAQGNYQYKAVKTGSWDAIGSDSRGNNANSQVFTNASGGSGVFDFFVNALNGSISISNHSSCSYFISPASVAYPLEGGASSVTLTTEGICPWAATSNVPWVAITSATSGAGSSSINYTVASNNTISARSGSVTIAGQTFTVNQYGPPTFPVAIDGSVDTNHYGCTPLAVQQLGTSFGDSSTGQVDVANGNELDAGYGVIENGVLYLELAGNLSSDFTKLEIFFETGPGGQNTLTNTNPGVDFGGLNRLGSDGNGATNGTPGLTFDADFAPNYWIGVNCGGAPVSVFANYAQLEAGGSNGYFLGQTVGTTNGTLFGGTNPAGVQVAVNNINILGVSNDGCYDDPFLYGQGSVTTGVELGIPLAALGSPKGAIKVCAFFSGVNHDVVSDQILGSIDGSIGCTNNLGESSLVNFSTYPGTHYFVVGPEMRITGISKGGSSISVTWLTGANSNLVYQLQSTRSLTPASWSNVGSPTNGTGLATTQLDSLAATNSTLFYRVKQTPVCPP